MGTHDPSEVPSITTAPAALAEDQWRRMRQYLVQMGLRIVLILVAALFVRGWLLWVCVAGAVVLPYSAVILANAGRDRSTREVTAVTPTAPREIEAGPAHDDEPEHRVIDHDDSPEDH